MTEKTTYKRNSGSTAGELIEARQRIAELERQLDEARSEIEALSEQGELEKNKARTQAEYIDILRQQLNLEQGITRNQARQIINLIHRKNEAIDRYILARRWARVWKMAAKRWREMPARWQLGSASTDNVTIEFK